MSTIDSFSLVYEVDAEEAIDDLEQLEQAAERLEEAADKAADAIGKIGNKAKQSGMSAKTAFTGIQTALTGIAGGVQPALHALNNGITSLISGMGNVGVAGIAAGVMVGGALAVITVGIQKVLAEVDNAKKAAADARAFQTTAFNTKMSTTELAKSQILGRGRGLTDEETSTSM